MDVSSQRSKLLTVYAILAAALVIFFWATWQATLPAPGGFDAGIRSWVQSHEWKSGAAFLWFVTQIGSPEFVAGVAIFAAWLEHRAGNRPGAVLIVAVLVGAFFLDEGLKPLFHRARPSTFFGMPVPASYSYPSGHSLYSMSIYGLIAWRYHRLQFALIALIAAVGFSRIYLGVHYPSDVVGGFAVGAVWLAAAMLMFDGHRAA